MCKQKYYSKLSRKLATNKIYPKCDWSIIKIFLNNKKIPCIPPLSYNNRLAINFKVKTNYLTHSLQSNVLIMRPEAIYLPRYCADESLNTINFNEDDILNVIRKLNPNKAHGHD